MQADYPRNDIPKTRNGKLIKISNGFKTRCLHMRAARPQSPDIMPQGRSHKGFAQDIAGIFAGTEQHKRVLHQMLPARLCGHPELYYSHFLLEPIQQIPGISQFILT